MINFHRGNSKMEILRNFLIFCLCILSANAESKFYVLNTPNSLKFTGTEPLASSQLDTVAQAAIGNSIQSDDAWSGLVIKDPFDLPTLAVFVQVDGAEDIQFAAPQHTYSVTGNDAGPALATLKESANTACDVNFNQLDALVELKDCLPSIEVPAVQSAGKLDASNTEDNNALTAIAAINALAESANEISDKVKFIVLRYSVESLKQTNAAGASEALELLAKAVNNLNAKIAAAKSNNVVVFAVATSEPTIGRQKREVLPPSPDNKLNLAVYYNQDYPAIFNIILWFMVVFGFSLLAICYAIGDMDPGRDSIIYRMTSTRMKKDN